MRRSGSRTITACPRTHIAALTLVALTLASRPSAAGIADARAAGRAGVDLLALHASPGAPAPDGWRLQLASARPHSGSGLADNALRLLAAGGRAAASLAWEQRSSPVHRGDALVATLQARQPGWGAGIGVRLRRLAFAGYAARWSSEWRFGGSLRRRHAALVARAIPRPAGGAPARFDIGGLVSVHRHASLVLQHTRQAGGAGHARGALTLHDSALALHVGYDIATRSVASGFEARKGSVQLVYAVRNHPELGWSHSWMLELGDASAWR